jgi:hypothetical protein
LGKERRHRIPDLPGDILFGPPERESVREALEARALARRDAAVLIGVRESPPREIVKHRSDCRSRFAPFHSSENVKMSVTVRFLVATQLKMLWQISPAPAPRNVRNTLLIDGGDLHPDVVVKVRVHRKLVKRFGESSERIGDRLVTELIVSWFWEQKSVYVF